MQELMKLTIVKREDAKHKLGNWMIGQDVQLCAMICKGTTSLDSGIYRNFRIVCSEVFFFFCLHN